MGRIEKFEDGAAVRADIVVDDPAFFVVAVPFVVRFVSVLVERVSDAFFEDPFGVFG